MSDAAAAAPSSPPCIAIGDARIGPGRRTYVIAEIGVNHDGDVDKALRLVEAARVCGADAAKFQVYRAADLTTADAEAAAYQRASGARSQRELLTKLELDDAALRRLHAQCATVGIEFLATPFGARDIQRLLELGVRAFKTASTDLSNLPHLRAVARSGLPLIVSTGAALREEIAQAVQDLDAAGARQRVVLMHCISAYPTPLHCANLRAIRGLSACFGVPIGFSDHTADTRTGGWAVAAGACVLEKHITLDRSAAGPDHACSLEPGQFREFVEQARAAEAALGSGALGMQAIEEDVRRVARKSIVAAGPLRAGTILSPGHLTAKRPGGGIDPHEHDRLVGRRLKRALAADERLSWEAVE